MNHRFGMLKRSLMLGISVALWAACTQDRKVTPPPPEMQTPMEDTLETTFLALPYVTAMDESGEALHMEKNQSFDARYLVVDSLAKALELTYPEIPLHIQSQHSDTLYVQIKDAHFLTQQMGSTGARSYLAEATYAFTEIPEIRVVVFHFEEGDHARPGAYTRAYFEKSNRIE